MNAQAVDGSRQFLELPQTVTFERIRTHLTGLAGAKIQEFISDGIVEMWLDFELQDHQFTINNQFGDYWFFVKDSNCPESVLETIASHFERILVR